MKSEPEQSGPFTPPQSVSGSGSFSDQKSSVRKAAIGFILLTLFIDILGIGLIIPVLPDIVAQLTKDPEETKFFYGAIIGVYALMQFLAAPIIGSLSDRFGRRPVLLISMVGLAIDFLLTYFSPNLTWLFIARMISGATAANITAANAYIADVSDETNRVRNFGLFGATIGIAFIIGPAVGGLIGQTNPRLPFLFAAGFSALNFLYGYFVLPESFPPEKRGNVRKRKYNPFGGLSILSVHPSVTRLGITIFLIALAQQSLQATWILYTKQRFGWDSLANGLSLTAVGVLTAIMQGGLVGRITRSMGERRALLLGLCAAVIASIGYGLATQGWMMYATMCIGAFGGLVQPVIQSTVAKLIPPDRQGEVQGGLTSLSSLAAVLAPPMANSLFAIFSGENAIANIPGISFLTGAMFISIGTMVAMSSKHPEPKPRTS